MPRIHHRHRKRILARDRNRCFFCPSKRNLDIHHIKPQCKGGSSEDENCVTACDFCHGMLKDSIERMIIKRFQELSVNNFDDYWNEYDKLNKDNPFRTVPPKAKFTDTPRFKTE